MGRYYALEEGQPAPVAEAIARHYAPQGPADDCPTDPVAVTVALADKIDTLTGFFAIGEKPTGSRDPYALRRAGLGVIRSEEHTSELQSLMRISYAVFCLKKKKTITTSYTYICITKTNNR